MTDEGAETVLVLEDEAAIRSLARRILEARGYRVLEARSGLEALATARVHAGPIHLLLTDVVLPGLSGKETAERLRQLYPSIRVVFTSGYGAEEIVDRGGLLADTDFLEKPFSPGALVRKIREVLDRAA